MQQRGFADSHQLNPIGMGLVFALHAGVLGAIILTPPDAIKGVIFSPLEIYNVPIKAPPPPPPLPQPEQRSNIAKVDRALIVPTNDPPDILTESKPSEPLPPEPRSEFVPTPPLAPVLVEAKPDPRFADALQPPYPSALARQEIEGKAVVRVLIGVDGRVKAVEPVSASDPAFHNATAIQALRRWRFKPGTRDGVPVESWRTMTVRFQLEG